jgi:hypothetical protein
MRGAAMHVVVARGGQTASHRMLETGLDGTGVAL